MIVTREAKKKKKNNIENNSCLLYCFFLCSLFLSFLLSVYSFLSQMIMHYAACWALYGPKWMAYIYTQKGVFKWLILHFYSISFSVSSYTKHAKRLARFIMVFVVCPQCMRGLWHTVRLNEAAMKPSIPMCPTTTTKHFALFPEPFSFILGQNQDMIYGFGLLFLSISIFSLMWKWNFSWF